MQLCKKDEQIGFADKALPIQASNRGDQRDCVQKSTLEKGHHIRRTHTESADLEVCDECGESLEEGLAFECLECGSVSFRIFLQHNIG